MLALGVIIKALFGGQPVPITLSGEVSRITIRRLVMFKPARHSLVKASNFQTLQISTGDTCFLFYEPEQDWFRHGFTIYQ